MSLLHKHPTDYAIIDNAACQQCIFCEESSSYTLALNNGDLLCKACYENVSRITYPEIYEQQHREFLLEQESYQAALSHLLAHKLPENKTDQYFSMGCISFAAVALSPAVIVLPAILWIYSYIEHRKDQKRRSDWEAETLLWHRKNHPPTEPQLRHFHDPLAQLTEQDFKILRVFEHWPGYPPFWHYLRDFVFKRDRHRCQVTGCPSRLQLHAHHKIATSNGGPHSPINLVTLCEFHHALEPDFGHGKIWSDLKNDFFTLVRAHERSNRATTGFHMVRPHLRRRQLITYEEVIDLHRFYGFLCPLCSSSSINYTVDDEKNTIQIVCDTCSGTVACPQLLAEETGPLLGEILNVSHNQGTWKHRWDVLSERIDRSVLNWRVPAKKMTNKEVCCPKCGEPMRLKNPREGDKWKTFWGCPKYPKCDGTRRYFTDPNT